MKSRKPSAAPAPAPPSAFAPGFLRRFLAGLPLAAGILALGLWGYALWGWQAVDGPAREALDRGDDAGVVEAVRLMETSHVFAGYEPYHGFGPKSAPEMLDEARRIVGRAAPYSPAETRWLGRNIAFYIPAVLELKGEGGVPLVPGDRELAEGLRTRWDNALHSNCELAAHMTLVTLLLGVVWFVYRKYNLYDRIGA
ncbi:MAG: hypothetical protein FJ109_15630 [Deltaproteobacteria bacterium]|nr:hypothetical protein [Deltaproteobacteria bacterium]